MAALTASVHRSGAAVDLGPGGRQAARTTGPAGGDRSAAVSSGTRSVRSWPLVVLAAPAAAEVFSGWAGIAKMTGFGLVSPLPGIWPSLHLDTSITLPVGVEAYAAYALRAWLSGGHAVSGRTRRFAKWSAICSFALGMAGQVAYHLLAQAGAAQAPWPVTTVVSCRFWFWPWDDAGPHAARRRRRRSGHTGQRDQRTSRTAVPGLVRRGPGRCGPGPGRTPGACGRVRSCRRDHYGPGAGPRRQSGSTQPVRHRPGTTRGQQAHSSGRAGIQTYPAQRGNQGLQPRPGRPGAHDQRRAGGHSSCPGQTLSTAAGRT